MDEEKLREIGETVKELHHKGIIVKLSALYSSDSVNKMILVFPQCTEKDMQWIAEYISK